ncbi:uncharacterized protein LOC124934224 [Impatiens glandulifera]|uniref:uncharacterized protein LOC124934224 n=1 Tax=Impatiens glandulifera TaxID=253017 RepID=UPI001FB180C7|nr:uncharacterized protein LOC124934224 [Impatiens glandulifera]
MSLLEVITKASADLKSQSSESNFPIILNSDPILLNLMPQINQDNKGALVRRVNGWKVSKTDTKVIDSDQQFLKKLQRQMKNPSKFGKTELMVTLKSFLETNCQNLGISHPLATSDEGRTRNLIEKLEFSIGREVKCAITEACIMLEIWDLLETLIVSRLVQYPSSTHLVSSLIENNKSDLLCLCIEHISDLQASDILCILKYFLNPTKAAYTSLEIVRKEWESQSLIAISKANLEKKREEKLGLACEAAILLMIAHDEFSDSELCLHYILASPNIDEVILSSCVSKLNGEEIMRFVKYMKKWLNKYDRFPEASPCPIASSELGLTLCQWVPKLKDILKCLNLVVDEHFLSLVLHTEFHDELVSLKGIVESLSGEARLCCSIAHVIKKLKSKDEGMN